MLLEGSLLNAFQLVSVNSVNRSVVKREAWQNVV